MQYEYTLVIDGLIRRRDYNEFKTGIIAMMTEDLNKLSSEQKLFEIKIRRVEWKDKQTKIDWRE
jgi:hypothetical protein